MGSEVIQKTLELICLQTYPLLENNLLKMMLEHGKHIKSMQEGSMVR